MDYPLISIIIPAHNVAPYLSRCVDSIVHQSGAPFEIILVDDSSTDTTGRICDAYAQKDSRVHALHCNFRDVSLTRNAGLDIARGAYIGFADGDDIVSSGFLEWVAAVIREHHPDIIRYGFREVFPGGSTKDRIPPDSEGLCDRETLRRDCLDGVSPANVLDYSVPRILTVYAHVFRREFLQRNGLRFVSQTEILSEDYLFVLHSLFLAKSVYHLPQVLYDYMVRPGSLSRQPKSRMMQRKKALIQAYLQFVPTEDPEMNLRLRNFYIDSVYDCFVNACTQSASRKEALERIRPLLRDPDLKRCLQANRHRMASVKTRCICFLMAHRMSLCMYLFYQLIAGARGK